MAVVAGFVGGALGIGSTGVFAAGASFAATALGSVAVRLVTSVALSALARAIAPKAKVSVPGLRTDQTLTGGINPEAFILGRFGTAGALGADLRSHGTAGQTPNAFLTYVVELAGLPGHQLDGLLLNGEPVEILSASPHADYGKRIGGRFDGRAWIKYYDGTQTAADPMLLAKYPAPHVRPWSAAMVGRGICYAIVTFQYDREVFTQFPAVKFVLAGVPLYDPRKDSTAGGSGSQRWANPATWAATQNPVVMIYNILRGIALGGDTWGGGIPAADLPYAIWSQAMDACDAQVPDGNGGLEPAHRAGMEILAEDEPYQVIEELLNACNGALAEAGGVWGIRIGGPGLPVMTITDDDLMADAPDDYRPFPPITEVFNGVEGTWTDPDSAWEARDATPRYNPAWEAEDGGRRLVASVSLPAVTRGTHAQRLMAAKIADHRRMRIHQIVLPPAAEVLTPLDSLTWTSASNGYAGKLFEVVRVGRELLTGRVAVTLRETDPGDFIPPVVVRPSVPDVTPVRPAAQTVPGWYVEPWHLTDSAAVARRPALRAGWAGNAADDARGIKIALRKLGDSGDGDIVAVTEVTAGEYVHAAVVPGVAYQMRARLVADRPTLWSAWATATAPDIRVSWDDLSLTARNRVTDLETWMEATEPTIAAMGDFKILVTEAGAVDDLVLDPVFALGAAKWPTSSLPLSLFERNLASATWQYRLIPAPRAWRVTPDDGPSNRYKGTGRFPVTPGEEIRLSFDAARWSASCVGVRAGIRYFDTDGVQLIGKSYQINAGVVANRYQSYAGRTIVPDDAADAEVYIQAYGSSATLNAFITNISAKRGQEAYASGALKISVETTPSGADTRIGLLARAGTANAAFYLQANTDGTQLALLNASQFFVYDSNIEAAPFAIVDGEVYVNGRLTARYLDVDELVTIRGQGALAAFKNSPTDDADGLFFGQVKSGATTRFAMAASRRNSAGLMQMLRFDSDGFSITNADFFYDLSTPDALARRTTSMAVTTLTGAQMVRVPEVIGGGGGGRGQSNSGSAGGTTTVTLFDGAVVKMVISAAGGTGGVGIGGDGRALAGGMGNDPGNRGGGGRGAMWQDANGSNRYGRGGDAGGRNGLDWIDVSSWTTPRIAITIGAGGAAGPGAIQGTAGVAGAASYQIMTAASIRAAPLPPGPTASGSFTTVANTAGNFPELGPGLWVLHTASGTLLLGDITPGPGGHRVKTSNQTGVTFPASSPAPHYAGGSSASTVNYLFYTMKGI